MAGFVHTIALRPGMRVIDLDDRRHVEHTVAAVTHPAPGCWDVSFADSTTHALVGARHGWLDVTP